MASFSIWYSNSLYTVHELVRIITLWVCQKGYGLTLGLHEIHMKVLRTPRCLGKILYKITKDLGQVSCPLAKIMAVKIWP